MQQGNTIQTKEIQESASSEPSAAKMWDTPRKHAPQAVEVFWLVLCPATLPTRPEGYFSAYPVIAPPVLRPNTASERRV